MRTNLVIHGLANLSHCPDSCDIQWDSDHDVTTWTATMTHNGYTAKVTYPVGGDIDDAHNAICTAWLTIANHEETNDNLTDPA